MAAVSSLALGAAKKLATSKRGQKVLAWTAALVLALPVTLVVGPAVGIAALTGGVVGLAPGLGGDVVAPGCGDDTECTVSDDDQQLAAEIMAATAAGKVSWLSAQHRRQVENYAAGAEVSAACTLDTRVLQLIVLTINKVGQVGISSLNRRCTGETPGAGQASQHWKGRGVDFYSFGGKATNGADAVSVSVIQFFDPIVPPRSGVGQSDCRRRAGTTVTTGNFIQFPDGCHHLHLQVPDNDVPLALPAAPRSP